jgi:hypothetical protein
MSFSPLTTLTAAGIALAGALGLSGDGPAGHARSVLYCTGCLCQEERPVMSVPGTWVQSGTMGSRITLRFVPSDPHATRLAEGCRPARRG